MKATKDQLESIANYRRMGIDIEILDEGKLKITQARLINGFILNQKQLTERAWEVFPGWRVVPIVFSLDVGEITLDWIQERMEEFGIKRKDLIKQLAIDKASLSLYLNEKRPMDKSQKAAFYYYFLTYELNRDFRETINNE